MTGEQMYRKALEVVESETEKAIEYHLAAVKERMSGKSPKIIGIEKQSEPLLPSGFKYVAFICRRVEGGIMRDMPLYLAAETVPELKRRVLCVENVAEWFHTYRETDRVEAA